MNAALKVGAAIEEIDILDLRARLTTTMHGDIQQTGEVHQPQHLDTATYQSILSGVSGQHDGSARPLPRKKITSSPGREPLGHSFISALSIS